MIVEWVSDNAVDEFCINEYPYFAIKSYQRDIVCACRLALGMETDDAAQYITVCFNSLAHGKFERNFRHVIFKQILVIDGWGICCEIALISMPLDFTDYQSTLVQVMA